MTKQKEIRVWIIEDDKEIADSHSRRLREHFKQIKIRLFDFTANLVDAKSKKSPDFIFYDMTKGLIPMGFDLNHLVQYDIVAIYERYPSSIIAIYSGMDEWAHDLVDEIIELHKDKKIFLIHASYKVGSWIEIIEKGTK